MTCTYFQLTLSLDILGDPVNFVCTKPNPTTIDLFAKYFLIFSECSGCFSLTCRMKFPVPFTEPLLIAPHNVQIAFTLSPIRDFGVKNFPSNIFGSTRALLLPILSLIVSLSLDLSDKSLLTDDSESFSLSTKFS